SVLINSLEPVIILGGFVAVFRNAVAGLISIGDVTFQFSAINEFSSYLGSIASMVSRLSESGVRIKEAREFFATERIYPDGSQELPLLMQAPEIELRNVSFKYPRAKNYVSKDL